MISAALRQEIEHTFEVVRHKCTDDEIVILCPECNDHGGHRGISIRTGQTFCFRCNKGQHNKGFFLAWAKALGYTFANEAELSTIPLRDLLAPVLPNSVIPVISKVKLPKGFTPIVEEPNSVYTKLITKMALRKHLDFEAFAEAGVGFTRVAPKWEAFAVFPVREYGTNVYYQGRTYIDIPGESTKLFPSKFDVKYGAAFWIYNIDELRQSKAKVAIVVESILNVLSLRRKLRELGCTDFVPVCVFKHYVSNVQVLKLIRCPHLREICLLFDHDAIEATWKAVGAMTNQITLTVAEMPLLEGNKKLDPNDNVDAAMDALDVRRRYDFSSAVWEERKRMMEHHAFSRQRLFNMREVDFSKAGS